MAAALQVLERERRRRAAVPALELGRVDSERGSRERYGEKQPQALSSREVMV